MNFSLFPTPFGVSVHEYFCGLCRGKDVENRLIKTTNDQTTKTSGRRIRFHNGTLFSETTVFARMV